MRIRRHLESAKRRAFLVLPALLVLFAHGQSLWHLVVDFHAVTPGSGRVVHVADHSDPTSPAHGDECQVYRLVTSPTAPSMAQAVVLLPLPGVVLPSPPLRLAPATLAWPLFRLAPAQSPPVVFG